ncbi:50S ribosomal protein L14 [Parcubacteria bacterium DG_74_3]|nr:MAG: 50S ribosomal protein L14 [Parcubacteria bacterium DG_74_3]
MIQPRTMLKVADNTGAKVAQCIRVLGSTRKRYAQIGEVIVVTIKDAEPRRQVKKHEVVRAVIIRQKQNFRRPDGSYIRFDDNACVILEGKTKEPKGGRVSGPVAREIKEKGFDKVAAMAEETV